MIISPDIRAKVLLILDHGPQLQIFKEVTTQSPEIYLILICLFIALGKEISIAAHQLIITSSIFRAWLIFEQEDLDSQISMLIREIKIKDQWQGQPHLSIINKSW